MKPLDFIAELVDGAKACKDIPASFTIAQAALESGWGESELYQKAKNIFGIKVYPGWGGAIFKLQTREYIYGHPIMVPADWCLYDSYAECIADHARFLKDEPRYAGCFAHQYSGPEFAIEVQRAGYSTDPDYAQKIASIIHGFNLAQYDGNPS